MLSISAPPIRLSPYTNEDSDGNAMLKAHAYLAQTAGSVVAWNQSDGAGRYIRGFVDETSNPAGVGDRVGYNAYAGGDYGSSVSFDVAKGEYFEIISDAIAAPTILWKSFGVLQKPVDFN